MRGRALTSNEHAAEEGRATLHRHMETDCFLIILLTVWCLKPCQRWLPSLPVADSLQMGPIICPCAHALGQPPPQDFGQNQPQVERWQMRQKQRLEQSCTCLDSPNPCENESRAACWGTRGCGCRTKNPAAHWPQRMGAPSRGHHVGPPSSWTSKVKKAGGILRLWTPGASLCSTRLLTVQAPYENSLPSPTQSSVSVYKDMAKGVAKHSPRLKYPLPEPR